MATSQVKTMHETSGVPVVVMGLQRRIMWSPVFENNPRISRTINQRCQMLLNGPNARPYIAAKSEERWTWRKWDIKPGEIYLTRQEQLFALRYAGCALIEPHTKVPNGNKAWQWERWQMLVEGMPHVRFVQTGPIGARPLKGVEFVSTSFREAAAILAVARAFVGTEGALHHAAAALNVPAVVLWSEFISPEITGYPMQANIRHADEPCGARFPCPTCQASMDAITVAEVTEALNRSLQ